MEFVGILLLSVLTVAINAVIVGALMFGIWNAFVFHHLYGTVHASFGACILVGFALSAVALSTSSLSFNAD